MAFGSLAILRALSFVVLTAVSAPALAQAPAPAPAEPAKTATDTLATRDLQALVDTLKDDKERARFIEQLETLLKARRAVEGGGAQEEAVTWLSALSDSLRSAVGGFFAASDAVSEVPALLQNVASGLSDPETREHWFGIVSWIAAVLIAGYAAFYLVHLILLRPRRGIEAQPRDSAWSRVLFALARAVLELFALAAFGGGALAASSFVEADAATRGAALALVNAKLAVGVIMVVARVIFAPRAENLRPLSITGETAQYFYIWCGRIAVVSIYGFFIAEALRLLGLSPAVFALLLHLVGLGITILLIILILQNREAVANRIRAPQTTKRPFAAIRRPLAATWHWLAILYVVALYLVLGIRGADGTQYILQGTIATAVIVAVAWALENLGRRAIRRGLTINEDIRERFPGLQGRLNRYTVAIDYAFRILIVAVATVSILQAWGVQAFAWVVSATGERVVASAVNIVLITLLAVLIWEVASSLIERRLSNGDNGATPSTRARTLLPLAQTALKLVLVVLVTMVVLAEVGMNITPLLAGAGVVGLAVGFGAQKLVQDVITGWFILLEDTIAVGDVAEVAGHAGLVERINIRTIRLRDLSGVVHTIPFSTVDAVKNFTKDFSYYLFEVGVAYREDTDEVVGVLQQIDAEMREDPDYKSDILEPLEVLGVDRFEDSAVVVRVRTKTRPLRQWAVGREFNRRMKKAFDARGIEIPFPHTTVYFGVGKDDTAPPAHLRFDRDPTADRVAEAVDAGALPAPADGPPADPREKTIAEDPDEDGGTDGSPAR